MQSTEHLYNELSYYTLAHTDPSFIHQHVVDAFAAQTADEHTKPIKITFALVGLSLYLEKNYTGKEVQRAHMKIAKHKMEWPMLILSENRGAITVVDVLGSSPGEQRDQMIHNWCVSVWELYSKNHTQIADFLRKYFFEKK